MMIKKRKGLTIVELMVTIILIGMVVTLAGSLFNFSSRAEKITVDEYDLQAEVRLATEILNKAIRNASVTFTISDELFGEAKKAKWSYFGIEGNKEIVQYIWKPDPLNPDTGTHERHVLVSASDRVSYNLYFKQNIDNTRLLEFDLDCYIDGQEVRKIGISTELEALNSVAVEDGGSEEDPAVAIAYRSDPKPSPETVTTHNEVQIAVALVLDDSGSMEFDMDGHNNYDHNFDSDNVRKDILKVQAKQLIDKFAAMENVQVCIVPFAKSANNTGAMMDATTFKSALKHDIDNLSANGGTNTGDGLRRGYHVLNNYNLANPGEEIVNYIILLSDGNPTYYSRKNGNYIIHENDINENNDVEGTGRQEEPNMSNSVNYVNYIGQNLVVGKAIDIKTFVIGFSNVPTEINRAENIAEHACTSVTNPVRYGTYYEAGSEVELEDAFTDITQTILQETWHIYGPY